MSREQARAYLKLPVTVSSPLGSWSGRTRDISTGGALLFLEPPYPSGPCTLSVELPDGALTASAEVRFTIPNVGVGFQFVDLPDDLRGRLQRAVDAASATFGLWGMVGKYLTEHEPRAPLRLPGAQESLFAELRATLRNNSAGPRAADAPAQHVLHPVGENGAAYRILFRRPGCVAPSESPLAAVLPGFLRTVGDKVWRVAPQDVWLKLHSGSQPRPYRVVQLTQGGHAAVVVSQVPGAPPRVSLLTLSLGEQIAVSLRGSPVFPAFTDEELEEIRLDSVKNSTTGSASAAPLPANLRFTDFAPYDESGEGVLTAMLRADPQSEVRTYGSRTVTLHPHVLLRVRDARGNEEVGVPLHDGRRYTLLQLTADGFGRVIPLQREKQFSVLIR